MKNKKLVIAMANYMDLKFIEIYKEKCYHAINIRPEGKAFNKNEVYSPLTNGNQLNEFIEKARIHVNATDSEWWTTTDKISTVHIAKDRNTAIFKCIAKLLNVDYEEV